MTSWSSYGNSWQTYAGKAVIMTLGFENFPLDLITGTSRPRDGETGFCKLEPKELVSNLEFDTCPERWWHGIALSVLRKEPQILAFKSLPVVFVRRLENWLGLFSTSLFSPCISHCYSLSYPMPHIHWSRLWWLWISSNWAFPSAQLRTDSLMLCGVTTLLSVEGVF